MTNASSRQKANNGKNNAKNAPATAAAAAPANANANAQVKPASAKATAAAAQAPKAAATVAAAPTREVASAGKKPNANKNDNGAKNASTTNKNANTNTSAAAAKPAKTNADTKPKNTTPFALTDITAGSVQRARQIRKTDFERFQKFHNFFVANDEATARTVNAKANAKREQVDQWVRGAVNPKALTCIQEIQETQQALLVLLTVSAALTKYGEKELGRRDNLGEMDNVIGARFGTSGLRSKQHVPQMVGISFVLRLVLGLAPEKRSACQLLREILNYDGHARLVLTPTTKGLQPAFGAAAADADGWATTNQNLLRQMVRQAQSDRFQEAMQQLGGQHLYDAIRTQLTQAGGEAVWEAGKDRPALQANNIRPRSNSTEKAVQQKQAPQSAKKNAGGKAPIQAVKKHLPVEVEKWAQVPPPAPVTVKAAANNAQIKKDAAVSKPKAHQVKGAAPEKTVALVKNASPAKNAAPVKNASPVKTVSPVKNASPVKNVSAASGPIPGTIAQSRPGAIVSSATPTAAVRTGRASNNSRGRAM